MNAATLHTTKEMYDFARRFIHYLSASEQKFVNGIDNTRLQYMKRTDILTLQHISAKITKDFA